MGRYRIGIECESIEGKNPTWGVGKIITRLLQEISRRPELEKEFKFLLYFKDSIPNLTFLNSSIFEMKTTSVPYFPNRLFPIYYYALLPMRHWFERLDAMFWPNYMLPIISFENSLVLLTEDVYHETVKGNLPFRYRLAYGIFAWWAAIFAERIMTICDTSKKNVSQIFKIRPERIFVNHLGIDIHENLERKSVKYVLYVGQAFPRRHLRETILAFEKIHSNFKEYKLIAIGPDKYGDNTIDSLMKQVNARLGINAIRHMDYVPEKDLLNYYANASALIYVSDREAFGLPPMEALSFGVPPIVADNELGHELFGDYAIFAKANSVDGIANAITEALTDETKIRQIREGGKEFVKRYSWQKFTDRWLEIIRGMVK